MSFNYASEKRKFDAMWAKLRVEYREAGMEESAIAAMYEFDCEDARRGMASASVGSVSETYVAPAELSPTTLYLREIYYRQVAQDFLVMQRGVRHA